MNEDTWCQSTLPINLGGLGLRLASEVALPAFLSSAFGAKETVKDLVPLSIKDDPNLFFDPHFFCTQHFWTQPIFELDIF